MEISIKDTLRKNMLCQRKNMKLLDANNSSTQIIDTIMKLPKFINCKNIMLYISFNKEVDTYPLAKWCLAHGKTVIAPYCIKPTKQIIPYKINNLTSDLIKSTFGVMEPNHNLLDKVNIEDIDLIIVPGVVFDNDCNRIGLGAGYYDRFLLKILKSTLTIGIAYDYQIIDKVPTDKFDIPLDFIITERRTIFPK
ncbi:5-formyltetrahydrofolate cyclo-ligase [Clostridium psychrophilum]|uniref:5-formyltetrahydrofolate cyclo-ligase n=1 Tax=Clostridium psychrophilum TaxID=132926 RepID=UPI001C0D0478|nr:5-formyltetrahydrofolate cyclo-ligase [Clostridium psychrophilum]MBU3182081.1 5-formyltetrahydrofolate cyclo-ligase [Clostridium psychrophilum]